MKATAWCVKAVSYTHLHNQFHQFFHEYFIPRVVGYLLDVQFFCLFEVFNTLFPALLDILYQQFQILGVERFSDIRIGSPQITFRMVVLILSLIHI